jgi:hypothetical protein
MSCSGAVAHLTTYSAVIRLEPSLGDGAMAERTLLVACVLLFAREIGVDGGGAVVSNLTEGFGYKLRTHYDKAA